jgi:hypothetical protein
MKMIAQTKSGGLPLLTALKKKHRMTDHCATCGMQPSLRGASARASKRVRRELEKVIGRAKGARWPGKHACPCCECKTGAERRSQAATRRKLEREFARRSHHPPAVIIAHAVALACAYQKDLSDFCPGLPCRSAVLRSCSMPYSMVTAV